MLSGIIGWSVLTVLLCVQIALLLALLRAAEFLFVGRLGLPYGAIALIAIPLMLVLAIPAASVPSTGYAGIVFSFAATALAAYLWVYRRLLSELRRRYRRSRSS
jgi:hypothetical protein